MISMEVVKLGEKLVEELELSSSNDTLGKWMSHHLAELLTRVEHADNAEEKKTAEKECTELILQVWSHRAALPLGRIPLESFNAIASSIHKLHKDTKCYYHDPLSTRGEISGAVQEWLSLVDEFEALAHKVINECFRKAIEAAEGEEEEWLRQGVATSNYKDYPAEILKKLQEFSSLGSETKVNESTASRSGDLVGVTQKMKEKIECDNT